MISRLALLIGCLLTFALVFQNCTDVRIKKTSTEGRSDGLPAPGPGPGPNPGTGSVKLQLAGEVLNQCLVKTDATVKCWGNNSEDQLGFPSTTGAFSSTPVTINGLTGVVQIAPGDQTSCALLRDKTVRCWGSNRGGGLGNGTTVDSVTPVAVVGLSDVIQISNNDRHACALLSDRTVKCWGDNNFGQLGNGQSGGGMGLFSSVPVAVLGLTGVRQVVSGFASACAILADGSVKCWGQNAYRNLGVEGNDSSVPVAVPGLTGVVQLTASQNYNWCALLSPSYNSNEPVTESSTFPQLTDGSVKCWGNNDGFMLGTTGVAFSANPIVVPGLSVPIQVSSGGYHNCALISDGSVKCWGHTGAFGKSDLAGNIGSATPFTVPGLAQVTQIMTGHYTTCAIGSDATVKCLGMNYAGALGAGSSANESTTPLLVNY